MIQGEQDDTWPFIASIIYTTVWCLSFYAQVYENWRLKSVEGLNLSYFALNFNGYAFYTIYSSVGYFIPEVKGAGTVVIADLIFVYNAMAMMLVQLFQFCIYEKGKNRLSTTAVVIVAMLWILEIVTILLYLTGVTNYYEYWNPISVMGYCKLLIVMLKCTPQAYYNYKRKSTKGWSIGGIITDLIGGVFSMASGGLSVSNGLNISKVILAFLSIFYDLLFCFQHYVLYRHPKHPKSLQNDKERGSSLLQ